MRRQQREVACWPVRGGAGAGGRRIRHNSRQPRGGTPTPSASDRPWGRQQCCQLSNPLAPSQCRRIYACTRPRTPGWTAAITHPGVPAATARQAASTRDTKEALMLRPNVRLDLYPSVTEGGGGEGTLSEEDPGRMESRMITPHLQPAAHAVLSRPDATGMVDNRDRSRFTRCTAAPGPWGERPGALPSVLASRTSALSPG